MTITNNVDRRELGRYQNQRRVEDGRLAYYVRTADAEYWDEHWDKLLTAKTFFNAERGKLPIAYERQFLRHLPKIGRILEAGCGMGQIVVALCSRGYDVEGVEWGEPTVKRILELKPDLPIRTGDVTQLDVPNDFYAGYISLGVVEHRQAGPEPFLREAFRVIRPGGVIVITVPYFNPLRRFKTRLRSYGRRVDGLDFFQYAFLPADFQEQVRQVGFEIIEESFNSVVDCIRDESKIFRYMTQHRLISYPMTQIGERIGPLRKLFGHMMMIVAKKPL